MDRRSHRFSPTAAAAAAFGLLAVASAFWVLQAGHDPHKVPPAGDVAGRVMSPFCPGLSLEECPSQQALALRAGIERKIASGATNAEIDRWLVAEYGESVLGRPVDAAAWAVPAAFVAAGFLTVAYLVRGRDRRADTKDAAEDALARARPAGDHSAYRAQLREDLSRFSEGTE